MQEIWKMKWIFHISGDIFLKKKSHLLYTYILFLLEEVIKGGLIIKQNQEN